LTDIEARDGRDSERAISPLTKAQDAHLLDTTELSIEAAFKTACRLVEAQD
jgi:cytidylate kinase